GAQTRSPSFGQTEEELRQVAHVLEEGLRLAQPPAAGWNLQQLSLVGHQVPRAVNEGNRSGVGAGVDPQEPGAVRAGTHPDVTGSDMCRTTWPRIPLINLGESVSPKRLASSTA